MCEVSGQLYGTTAPAPALQRQRRTRQAGFREVQSERGVCGAERGVKKTRLCEFNLLNQGGD